MPSVLELNDERTLNDVLSGALSPIGLPCCEEPTASTDSDRPYITWMTTGAKNLRASGATYARILYVTVTLNAPRNAEHAPILTAIRDALMAAGFLYAREGAQSWNAEVNRRLCGVAAAVLVDSHARAHAEER